MAKTNKDFTNFQKHFKSYQRLFGLTGYRIYFKYAPLGDSYASIKVSQSEMAATVTLNSILREEDRPFQDIKRSSLHEALHLLLIRLEFRARSRYVMEEEIYEAVEEIVAKLEGLIEGYQKQEVKDGQD